MILATLLLLITPAEIKAQSAKHLQRLTQMSALETVGKQSYEVSFYQNAQQGVRPLIKHGVGSLSAWWSVWRDSQVYRWLEVENANIKNGGDGNFAFQYRYRDACGFNDDGRVEVVPCDGTIEGEGLNVRRITQQIHTRRWGTVSLVIDYGWVTLSEPRLVPTSMTLSNGGRTQTVTWANYREYRATEPKVAEVDR